MHYKRKRNRSRRAGCKLCKPWKMNGRSSDGKGGEKYSDHQRRYFAAKDIQQYS